MKKLAFIFSAVITCFLISCNDASKGGTSDRAQKNLENNKAVGKLFEGGDFSKLGDYVADDAVDHATPTGDVKGLDSLKALFTQYAGMASDMKSDVVAASADDNYSFVWYKQSWTAKMDDPMMGLKAGQRGSMESVEVCRHNADSKIAEHWSFMSMAEMMKMMPQSMPMPMDTTHKMGVDTMKKN